MKKLSRRNFVKNCAVGCGGFVLGWTAFDELVLERSSGSLTLGFRNDAPATLGRTTREALHWRRHGDLIECELCPHRCILGENDRGYCRARAVKDGRLHTLDWANPCAVHLDPIEKKPLFHFKPTSPILSIACAGCNLRCLNCQNWEISQKRPREVRADYLPPDALVAVTRKREIPAIAYTYTEPIIYFEFMLETARLAREAGIDNVMVTAGYIEKAPLRQLCEVLDAVTLDLKAFSEARYARISTGRLGPVLDGIALMKGVGVWVELSTLVVPTLSDDPDEVASLCRWIVRELGPDVPLHLLRFHPDFMLPHLPRTPVETLVAAREAALSAGLRFVYLGNVAGHSAEDTNCPRCHRTLIARTRYHIERLDLKDGACPDCGESIAGVWG